jgi:hypothetical protein
LKCCNFGEMSLGNLQESITCSLVDLIAQDKFEEWVLVKVLSAILRWGNGVTCAESRVLDLQEQGELTILVKLLRLSIQILGIVNSGEISSGIGKHP